MNDYDLDEFKVYLLKTFKAFINFCEQHGLTYYAAFGTALGAIRHQGFIPWDDDVDVYMPREDYNRLLALRGVLDSSKYEVIDIENKGYYLYFAKWCMRNSTLIEKPGEPSLGIYVDIFPLDSYCADYCKPLVRYNELYRYLWLAYGHGSRKHSFYSLFHTIESGKENLHINFTALLDVSIFKLLKMPARYLIIKFLKKLKNAPESDYYWLYSIISSESFPMPVEWFEEGRMMKFENIEIRIPNNYDAYLTRVYGNYMAPPPINKRPCHHARYFVDFNRRLTIDEIREVKLSK